METWEEKFLSKVQACERVAVFTGAGASADSGIPTFRGSASAWWAGLLGGLIILPILGTPFGWTYIPGICWSAFNRSMRLPIAKALPNPTHTFFAELKDKEVIIVTQNVDGLHQKAGSDPKDVYEVHGTVWNTRCGVCGTTLDSTDPAGGTMPEEVSKCECGGHPRPNAVLFTEAIPEHVIIEAARRFNDRKKLLVVIVGLSGTVSTSNEIMQYATRRGGEVVIVDPVEINPSVFGLTASVPISQELAASGEAFARVQALMQEKK